MTNHHDNRLKPQIGTWTLTAPDGRTWQAESPLHCIAKERNERVPATVQLNRIFKEVNYQFYPCGCDMPNDCPEHGASND